MAKGKFKNALFAILVFIPNASEAYPIHGVGSASCAEFAKLYQLDPANTETTFFSWAQGFMSGLNMSLMAANKPARELAGNTTDQKRALRNYCADNPLKNYMDAAVQFYGALPFIPKISN